MTDPIASRDLRIPKEYLSGDDVLGREVRLTIGRIEWDDKVPDPNHNGRKTTKPVAVFKQKWTTGEAIGKHIKVVINKARREQLIGLFGQDWKQWPENDVTVYCDGQSDGKGSPRLAPNRSRMVAFKGVAKGAA